MTFAATPCIPLHIDLTSPKVPRSIIAVFLNRVSLCLGQPTYPMRDASPVPVLQGGTALDEMHVIGADGGSVYRPIEMST